MSVILAILFAISAMTSPAMGPSMPTIGTIDYYGLRHSKKSAVERALQITPGDKVPRSPLAAEERIKAIPGVARARLNFVCCGPLGKTILYVGIQEKGAPELHFRPAPNGKARLPADIVNAGRVSEDALMKAVLAGDGEDDSPGYSLSHNPGLRAIEERFVTFTQDDRSVLRKVLHDSADANQRALAAEVLGYARDHRVVVPDLAFAMSDPDSGVRNNAMRALAIIAGYARAHPSAAIKIPTHTFINLLNSLVWSDRNKAGWALMELTTSRDPALLADLRQRAMLALIEMAQWKNLGHAESYCVILGRIAGLPEKEIWSDFQDGKRAKIIAAAQKAGPSGSTR